MPQLTVSKHGRVLNSIALGSATLGIGRADSNEICLPDDTNFVSRGHAELRPGPGGYSIVDLDSANGMRVDGRPVHEVVLAEGTRVEIGEYVLEYHAAGGGAAPPPGPGPREQGTVYDPPRIPNAAPMPSRPPYQPPGRVVPPQPVADGRPRSPNRRLWGFIGVLAVVAIVGLVAIYLAQPKPGPPPDLTTTPTSTSSEESTSTIPPEMSATTARPPVQDLSWVDNGIPQLPNESLSHWRTRTRDVRSSYEEGKTRLGQQDYVGALERLRDVPDTYPGLKALRDQIRRQLEATAVADVRLARDATRWDETAQWLDRAQALMPATVDVEAQRAAIIKEREAKAAEILNKANQHRSADSSLEVARQLYRQVQDLLPPEDKIRKDAEAALTAIGG